ncbi:anthranilate synthase component I family protein [Bacteroidota bacterium]
MRKEFKIIVKDLELFKSKLLIYGNKLKRFTFLDSNNFNLNNLKYTYYEYNFLAALNSVEEIVCKDNTGFRDLLKFKSTINDWLFGYFTYDLKNELENLESNKINELDFPNLHFYVPEIVLLSKDSEISILYHDNQFAEKEIYELFHTIESTKINAIENKLTAIKLEQRFNRNEYIETVKKLKNHIQLGDIYEINFCHEFYSKSVIDPLKTFVRFNEISPSPFSCYYKFDDKYLLSASPERFLKKLNSKIISQPIKGTIRRSLDSKEDLNLKKELFNDPKERAENVMIVDLVRNDLSRTAKKATVRVEELYGIYSFEQVHQMISTVSSEVDNNTNIIEIIKNAFPMGSMTGAPKVRAMHLIEQYEKTKRGLYSGSVGYITPDNNFDFNVVIRSILYNQLKKYVSFTVGGAITSLANPDKEYEESMVKAEAMLKVFS